ncbi:MAG TPA: NAD-dependent epimerase/dehydratase family protein [Solirubrobacterales bacterium]|jgi:UDP-glucose 4-epimerase|nr:NAD-dependent epimerase/dehydratase family protein [Solirubrobacterales bacterium]
MPSLVTGGAGFIGSHLVDALVERGDEVVILDDLSTGRRENLTTALEHGAELVEGDVTDPATVSELVEGRRPGAIFQLAAQIDVRVSVSDPVFDLGVNVGGTINLLEAARRAEVGRFVLASTGGAIYGEGSDRDLPLDETAECLPDAPYGQSKYAAEGYLSLYERLYGLSTAALRLGNVYGPRQDPLGEAGVVAIFCGALLEGRTPKVFGDGDQTRDYVYVADIVEAMLAAGDSSVVGTFNIGTGVETSVLELGGMIADACDRPFEPEMAPPRPGEVQRIAIASSLAADELGWTARTALPDGLVQTAASFGGD